jgi:hypothetical protein
MSIEQPITREDDWFVGTDFVFRFYCMTGPPVEATEPAAAAATSIKVKPLLQAIANETKVRFNAGGDAGPGVVATLSADAAAGAQTIAVSALGGAVQARHIGYQVEDITGDTLSWTVREDASEEAAALITKTTGAGVTTVDAANGIADVALVDDDTVNATSGALIVQPGAYQHALKRTNAGAELVLAYGPAELQLAAAR